MKTIIQIEQYAVENNIPIMEKEGIEFIQNLIEKNKVLSILEIGSAIGYSAIKMALINNNINIETVELNKERYEIAIENINDFNLTDNINIYNIDAFDFETNNKYDLIFIDAAKAQYIKFFEKFKTNLNSNGFIITDNLKFHGYVDDPNKKMSRNLRQLVGKIKRYIKFLEDNDEFETQFYNIGDGIAVSKLKTITKTK